MKADCQTPQNYAQIFWFFFCPCNSYLNCWVHSPVNKFSLKVLTFVCTKLQRQARCRKHVHCPWAHTAIDQNCRKQNLEEKLLVYIIVDFFSRREVAIMWILTLMRFISNWREALWLGPHPPDQQEGWNLSPHPWGDTGHLQQLMPVAPAHPKTKLHTQPNLLQWSRQTSE